MIARVFYKKQLSGDNANSENFLYQEKHLLTIGFDSMIDKLASIAGCLISVLAFKPAIYGFWRKQQQTSCVYNVETISSSIIAGISSIAGASGQVDIHSAFIIGCIGGFIYMFGSQIMDRFQLDDPLQATQTHLFCGIWGVIADGLVHKEKGLFTKGNGSFLFIQLMGALVIWAFTFALTYLFFKLVVRRFHLRLSKIEEILGLDCQEDEYRLKYVIDRLMKEKTKESLARLTLLHMVNSGNHIEKSKGRKFKRENDLQNKGKGLKKPEKDPE